MPDDPISTGVGDTPDNDAPPISPLVPGSMHRAEDDARAAATTPEFNERPDVPTHTAARATREPAPRNDAAGSLIDADVAAADRAAPARPPRGAGPDGA